MSIKKALLCLILLILSGCSASVQSTNTVNSKSNVCPEKPEGSLSSDRVKSIVLGTQAVKESGMVSPGKDIGYTFEAEAGQKLSYRTSQNVCAWIFTPNNEILNSTNFPVNGKYAMQVSALTGSTTFELEINLKEPEQPNKFRFQPASSDVNKTQSYQQSSTSDFPKVSCGDPLPSDVNDYPIAFYPVFVPYSEANLHTSRSLFCQDSLKVRRKDSQELAVQVSSFTSEEKSRRFAEFISSELSDVEVGQPTVIHQKY